MNLAGVTRERVIEHIQCGDGDGEGAPGIGGRWRSEHR